MTDNPNYSIILLNSWEYFLPLQKQYTYVTKLFLFAVLPNIPGQ